MCRVMPDLAVLLAQDEGQYFDRKSLWEGSPAVKRPRDRRTVRDEIGEYVAAFANVEGGVLVMGVEDDRAPRPSRVVPLIDQVHRPMLLWGAGGVVKVDEYLKLRALRRNRLFAEVLQALTELSDTASEGRSRLEKLSNHLRARGTVADDPRRKLPGMGENVTEEGA